MKMKKGTKFVLNKMAQSFTKGHIYLILHQIIGEMNTVQPVTYVG